jgi:hypothetical protein
MCDARLTSRQTIFIGMANYAVYYATIDYMVAAYGEYSASVRIPRTALYNAIPLGLNSTNTVSLIGNWW